MTDDIERDFYTASQAATKLGFGLSYFHRLVRQGRIPKYVRKGYKQGVYPKRDIDILASALRSVLEPEERYVFSRSMPSEQEEEMYIGIRAFGSEYITPLPERVAFQLKSEYTFWSLKVSGHVVAYVSMFRFLPEFLDDLLTGRRIEREITTDEVLPFRRGEPFDVYIDVMAVDPVLPLSLRRYYASVTISRFANVILGLLDNHYQIRTVYTVSATQEGDALIRGIGFREMVGTSQTSGRIAYEYPLDQAGIERLKALSRRT